MFIFVLRPTFFNNRPNFGITSAMFPFASFHSYSGKRGLMGQFDETLTQHECDEMFRRTARIKIDSVRIVRFYFPPRQTVKVPLFVALIMV